MSTTRKAYVGAAIFDGKILFENHALCLADGIIAGIVPQNAVAPDYSVTTLDGGYLLPGFVDLQVNGGGGIMFNDDPSVETLATIAQSHASLGATTILPTLITDTPDVTQAAIEAVDQAVRIGTPGIAGLHLEGPHLSFARKGAHDAALIRPMTEADLDLLVDAAGRLPALLVTLAPESATIGQVQALAAAGAVIALGHTDATYETCCAYQKAGATVVTHLFNAMSPLASREPGVVGAALRSGGLSAGLIADGIHVHPATIATALAAKTGPGEIFLVSDAMAPAGTELGHFLLNGRQIRREGGRLTLADGTLAGADLDLARAIRVLVGEVGVTAEAAFRMATSLPAKVAGLASPKGHLRVGERADIVRLSPGLGFIEVLHP